MVSVNYVLPDGRERTVCVPEGTSVMWAAVQNNVRGIDGECGGGLSCATCHVYVAEEWLSRLPAAQPMEQEMLEFVAAERRNSSRLGCQVAVTHDCSGLTVHVPDVQC